MNVQYRCYGFVRLRICFGIHNNYIDSGQLAQLDRITLIQVADRSLLLHHLELVPRPLGLAENEAIRE